MILFRYDFDKNLDLTKFNKQFFSYVPRMKILKIEEIKYHFSLSCFKLSVIIKLLEDGHYELTVIFSEVIKDSDNEILSGKEIYPLMDVRFQEIKLFKELWQNPHTNCGSFHSLNMLDIMDKIDQLIKLLYKINSLKVFI